MMNQDQKILEEVYKGLYSETATFADPRGSEVVSVDQFKEVYKKLANDDVDDHTVIQDIIQNAQYFIDSDEPEYEQVMSNFINGEIIRVITDPNPNIDFQVTVQAQDGEKALFGVKKTRDGFESFAMS